MLPIAAVLFCSIFSVRPWSTVQKGGAIILSQIQAPPSLPSLPFSSVMTEIRLPDALASWPFPRRINRYYDEVKAEAERWIHDLNVLEPKTQKAFDKCDFGG
jgi:hypothetical protein